MGTDCGGLVEDSLRSVEVGRTWARLAWTVPGNATLREQRLSWASSGSAVSHTARLAAESRAYRLEGLSPNASVLVSLSLALLRCTARMDAELTTLDSELHPQVGILMRAEMLLTFFVLFLWLLILRHFFKTVSRVTFVGGKAAILDFADTPHARRRTMSTATLAAEVAFRSPLRSQNSLHSVGHTRARYTSHGENYASASPHSAAEGRRLLYTAAPSAPAKLHSSLSPSTPTSPPANWDPPSPTHWTLGTSDAALSPASAATYHTANQSLPASFERQNTSDSNGANKERSPSLPQEVDGVTDEAPVRKKSSLASRGPPRRQDALTANRQGWYATTSMDSSGGAGEGRSRSPTSPSALGASGGWQLSPSIDEDAPLSHACLHSSSAARPGPPPLRRLLMPQHRHPQANAAQRKVSEVLLGKATTDIRRGSAGGLGRTPGDLRRFRSFFHRKAGQDDGPTKVRVPATAPVSLSSTGPFGASGPFGPVSGASLPPFRPLEPLDPLGLSVGNSSGGPLSPEQLAPTGLAGPSLTSPSSLGLAKRSSSSASSAQGSSAALKASAANARSTTHLADIVKLLESSQSVYEGGMLRAEEEADDKDVEEEEEKEREESSEEPGDPSAEPLIPKILVRRPTAKPRTPHLHLPLAKSRERSGWSERSADPSPSGGAEQTSEASSPDDSFATPPTSPPDPLSAFL